jgi:F-type H+-transporting ATPase subunit delta
MQGKISRRKLAQYAVDAHAKGTLSRALQEIAAYLIESRRLRETELVVRAIEDEFAARGTVVAHVATARPLTSELQAAIMQLVGAKEISIVESVDPDLIGGVRIETPGKLLDATIKRKLLALRQAKI